jgi:integrase
LGMAAITLRSGKYQIRVRHKLLPKPFFSTFDTEAEARAYATQLESLLDRGIVPLELLEDTDKRGADPWLSNVLAQYLEEGGLAPTDKPMVQGLIAAHGKLRVSGVTSRWADGWVADMKSKERLAPGTIRKRVGSLARALDWYWRHLGVTPANPLRLMPRGYSQYADRAVEDTHRDRRLLPGEEDAVLLALAGERRADRERPLPVDPALALMFTLIVNTGLRLKEAYRLRTDQIDTGRWVLNVEGTKGERGRIKPRVVRW